MSEKYPGKYIVIEGTDGAGTTTQKELLIPRFRDLGKNIIELAEPGGTPIGEALRLILKDKNLERTPKTNLDLFTICRRELAEQVIRPALENNAIVISDRNWLSTIAYQGFAEGIPVNEIIDKTKEALGDVFLPDFTAVIDVPVDISFQRMKKRKTSSNDYFEQRGRVYFGEVRKGYLWGANEFGLPVIDGTKSIESVHKEIISYLGKAALL